MDNVVRINIEDLEKDEETLGSLLEACNTLLMNLREKHEMDDDEDFRCPDLRKIESIVESHIEYYNEGE